VIDGSTRGHGVLRFASATDPGPPRRATYDGWKIKACPHHGPSLSIAADGSHHLVWFTGEGPRGPGAFYARSADGRRFWPAFRLDGARPASHAVVLARGSRVHIAYREFAPPEGARVLARTSGDGGATWSAPAEILATATKGSDHPFLVASGDQVYLSWFTRAEGLRVVALDPPVGSSR